MLTIDLCLLKCRSPLHPSPTRECLRPGGQQRTSFGGAGGGGGEAAEPLYVAIQEPSARTQFWKFIRSILTLLIVLAAVNQIMDERGLGGKGPMGHQEIVPEKDAHHVVTFDDVQGADEAKEELQEVRCGGVTKGSVGSWVTMESVHGRVCQGREESLSGASRAAWVSQHSLRRARCRVETLPVYVNRKRRKRVRTAD